MKAVSTPTLDKMLALKDKSQAIGEFLEWLQGEKKIALCLVHEHVRREEDGCYDNGVLRSPTCGFSENRFYLAQIGIERLLAEYFEVDQAAAERERQALLEAVREEHARGR